MEFSRFPLWMISPCRRYIILVETAEQRRFLFDRMWLEVR